jgi:hypothetical protein
MVVPKIESADTGPLILVVAVMILNVPALGEEFPITILLRVPPVPVNNEVVSALGVNSPVEVNCPSTVRPEESSADAFTVSFPFKVRVSELEPLWKSFK